MSATGVIREIKCVLIAIKGLFVLAFAVATAPSAAVFVSLNPTIACAMMAIVAMLVSDLGLLFDEDKRGANAAVVLATIAAGFALYLLPTAASISLASFTAILAALVVATVAAISACAAMLSPREDWKVYSVFSWIFQVAMCAVFATICFVL